MPDLSSFRDYNFTSYFEELQKNSRVDGSDFDDTTLDSSSWLWKQYWTPSDAPHEGNLNYYIGTQIAGTGYVRHREAEFNDIPEAKATKEQVLGDFDRAMSMVIATIRQQSPEDWTAPYSAEREAVAKERFAAFIRWPDRLPSPRPDHLSQQGPHQASYLRRSAPRNLRAR